jgi:hypothetical protein
MRATWKDVSSLAAARGFKVAGDGVLRGHSFVLTLEQGSVVVTNETLPTFKTTMSAHETAQWLARNEVWNTVCPAWMWRTQ